MVWWHRRLADSGSLRQGNSAYRLGILSVIGPVQSGRRQEGFLQHQNGRRKQSQSDSNGCTVSKQPTKCLEARLWSWIARLLTKLRRSSQQLQSRLTGANLYQAPEEQNVYSYTSKQDKSSEGAKYFQLGNEIGHPLLRSSDLVSNLQSINISPLRDGLQRAEIYFITTFTSRCGTMMTLTTW